MFQGLEWQLTANPDRRENFENLISVSQSASGGEAIGFRTDEKQVEQGFLSRDRARKRGGDRNRLLKRFTPRMLDECVEDQRMPHEKLILEFLDHRFAGLGPAAPVDVPQGITL